MIKGVQMNEDQSLQPIPIQFRLYATHNQKDKCIGLFDVNLAESMNQTQEQKVVFQKCFDKNATLSFEVRSREYQPKGVTATVSKASLLAPVNESEEANNSY